MEHYLKSLRCDQKNISDEIKVTLVIGNEACDLDSAVSAIVYAYFLHSIKEKGQLVFPLLNLRQVILPTSSGRTLLGGGHYIYP